MNDAKIFQIPASISQIKTLANCWRFQFDTQETITGEDMATVSDWKRQNGVGWLSFAMRQIEIEDIAELPEIKTDDTKTPGQRLRAVLFLNWKQNPEKCETFEAYYLIKMEKLINHYKERLA